MTPGLVLDASVTASWAFPDEHGPAAKVARERLRQAGGSVPALWWFEVRNTLLVNERRGRITPAQTGEYLEALAALPIVADHAPDGDQVLALARSSNLTVYDAAYLELALRRRLPLATLDRALAAAARTCGVALVGSGGG